MFKYRVVLFVFPIISLFACHTPQGIVGPDTGIDGDMDVESGDADVEAGDADEESVEPCHLCPDACISGRCADDNCQEVSYLVVNETLAYPGVIEVTADGQWLYAISVSNDGSRELLVVDASEPESLDLFATLPINSGFDVLAAEGYVYVVGDGQLATISVTDAENPEQVGTLDIWASQGTSQNGHLVLYGADRIQIINLSIPSAPSILGELPFPKTKHGIERTQGALWIDSMLYVGLSQSGLALVDVSTVEAPELVDIVELDDDVVDVSLGGSELLVATQSGFRSFNVADPLNPAETYRYDSSHGGTINSVFLWQDALLVVGSQSFVVEPSDESERHLGVPGYVTGVALRDRWGFLSTTEGSHFNLFSEDNLGIHTVDFDRTEMTGVTLPLENGEAASLAADGAKLYIGKLEAGLEVWDMTSLPSITRIGEHNGAVYDLVVEEGILYISAGTECVIRDANTFEELSRIPIESLSGTVSTRINGLSVDGTMLYITAKALTDSLMLIIDVTDPRAPEIVYDQQFSGRPIVTGIEASGQRAYVAYNGQGTSGVFVYDVSTPSTPDLLGRFESDELVFTSDLIVHDQYLLVAAQELYILDVSDPLRIELVGEWGQSQATGVRHMALSGSVLYAVEAYLQKSGLNVLDITEPEFPTMRFNYPIEGNRLSSNDLSPSDIVVAANFALIANGASGILALPLCE